MRMMKLPVACLIPWMYAVPVGQQKNSSYVYNFKCEATPVARHTILQCILQNAANAKCSSDTIHC